MGGSRRPRRGSVSLRCFPRKLRSQKGESHEESDTGVYTRFTRYQCAGQDRTGGLRARRSDCEVSAEHRFPYPSVCGVQPWVDRAAQRLQFRFHGLRRPSGHDAGADHRAAADQPVCPLRGAQPVSARDRDPERSGVQ